MQRDLQQEQKRTALLLQAVQAASSSPRLDQVLERIEAALVAAVEAQAGSIYLLDMERGGLLPRVHDRNEPGERAAARRSDLLNHLAGEPLVGKLLEERVPVVASRDEANPHGAGQATRALGVQSLLGVPIMVGDRLLGAALLYTFDDVHIFTADEIELAQGIANAVALIIENALLYQKTQRQLAASRSLQRVTAALLLQRGLGEILEIVVTEARLLTGALGCAILLLEDTGWLRVVCRTGPSTPAVDHISVEGTFTGAVLRRGELLLTNDPAKEIPLYDAVDRPTALLAVPLRAAGSIIGTLNVLDKPGGFTREDAQVISPFADQAAIAIENARLQQQAQDFAALEERQRIARDLHDSVTQTLYSISLSGEAAVRLLGSGDHHTAEGYVRRVRDAAQEALQEMRLLLLELHPPVLEQEGLVAALQARLEMLEGRAAVQTELDVEGEERLPLGVKEAIYRIAQEILNNVLKHAQAKRVSVRLHFGRKRVWLEVRDDGVGFEPATVLTKGGLGLRGMEERAALVAGTFSVESAPGRGTTVRLEVPRP